MTLPNISLTASAGLTTATTGLIVGLQGQATAFNAADKGLVDYPIDVFVCNRAASSTATVDIQTSTDGSSFTTKKTLSFTSAAGAQSKNVVMAVKEQFIRLSVTSISGATIQGYIVLRK